MKEDIEISKQLTDRAWADMRARLDKEMPEKRKKRPVFWLWLSGMLSLAMLCLIGLESDTITKAASISNFGVQHLIEQLGSQSIESNISTEKQLDQIKEKDLNPSPTPNNDLEETSPTNPNTEIKLEESLPERIQFEAKKGEPIAASNSKTQTNSISSPILPNNTEEYVATNPISTEKIEAIPNIETRSSTSEILPFIASGQAATLLEKEPVWEEATIPRPFILPMKNAKLWQVFATVALAQNEHVGLTWSAGAGLRRSLGKRWDIASNICFQQNYYPSETKFLIVPVQELENNVAADQAYLAANGVETYGDVSGFSVQNTQQWSVDIQPAFQIRDTWWLHGHAQFTRTIESETREFANFTQQKSSLRSILQNSDEKWRMLLGLGVDLRFAKRWEMAWNYRIAPVFVEKESGLNFSPITADPADVPTFDKRPQLFEVALRYQIF